MPMGIMTLKNPRFNPHPARRPGATPAWGSASARNVGFQSSPGPKAGCYGPGGSPNAPICMVSILTRPEGRGLRGLARCSQFHRPVSILTRPEGRVLRQAGDGIGIGGMVSILTRPEGRVLLRRRQAECHTAIVSILTRPEGRVLPVALADIIASVGVSILTRPEGRVLHPAARHFLRCGRRFNPHPARRPGATRLLRGRPCGHPRFNPHPARRPGATDYPIAIRPQGGRVSILTRPEGRVLRAGKSKYPSGRAAFQSSPGPKAGCYCGSRSAGGYQLLFQSSPGPKAGCY